MNKKLVPDPSLPQREVMPLPSSGIMHKTPTRPSKSSPKGADRSPKKMVGASPKRPSIEPDWAAFQSRPTALVQDCLLLLMGYSREHAIAKKICEYPANTALAKIYLSLLRETYYAMAAKHPLLKPVDGIFTRDRIKLQKVLLSLDYFVTLATSDFSPYRHLIELPSELKILRPPGHFEWPSARKVISELDTMARFSELKTSNLLHVDPTSMPKGDRYILRTLGALCCLVEEHAVKNSVKGWAWNGLNDSQITRELLRLMQRDFERNAPPETYLPKERAIRSHLAQAQNYYREFIGGRR